MGPKTCVEERHARHNMHGDILCVTWCVLHMAWIPFASFTFCCLSLVSFALLYSLVFWAADDTVCCVPGLLDVWRHAGKKLL